MKTATQKKASKKCEIVLAVGLPGSGKSTYFQRQGIQPLSSDTLRQWLLDDEKDQANQRVIFAALRTLLRFRLALGRRRSYVDATNLTVGERRPYIQIARRKGCSIRALYFDVPLSACLLRNRGRERAVPEQAMQRLAKKFVAPTRQEGFSTVTIIRSSHAERLR